MLRRLPGLDTVKALGAIIVNIIIIKIVCRLLIWKVHTLLYAYMDVCIAQTCMSMRSQMNTHVPVVFLNSKANILNGDALFPRGRTWFLEAKILSILMY